MNEEFKIWMGARGLIEDIPVSATRVVYKGNYVVGRLLANKILKTLTDNGFVLTRRGWSLCPSCNNLTQRPSDQKCIVCEEIRSQVDHLEAKGSG